MFENKCFIICPIGEPSSVIRERADIVLETLFRPAVSEMGLEAVRADHIELPGIITKHVIDFLCESPLVIADLTDSNPNVFYELGIRHALGKPAIHIIESKESLPFDLQGMRTIIIDHKNKDSIEYAKIEIRRQAKLIISGSVEHSFSVLELLGFKEKTIDSIIVDAARKMRKEFHEIIENREFPIGFSEFENVLFLIAFIRQIEPNNGHAHYYSGEVKRWSNMKDEAIREFLKYLETYKSRPSINMIDDTGSEICYKISHGYCRQRTGWINHLIAVYFMNDCEKATEVAQVKILAGRALLYATNALEVYPKGFTQYIATVAIIEKAKKIIEDD